MKYSVVSIVFFILFGFIFTAKSQEPKNVVKLNLPNLLFMAASPIGGSIPITYERAFAKHFSASVHFRWAPNKKLDEKIFESVNSSYDSTFYENPFNNINYGGFSIMPEIKYYTSGSKESPYGFYLSAYLKYTNYRVKSSFKDEFFDNNNASHIADVTLTGRFKPFGGGLAIGYQWIINDKIAIDWTILGLGWGSTAISVELKTDDPVVGKDEIDKQANKVKVNTEFGDVKIETTDKSATLTLTRGWPMMRFMGIHVGYAF